MRYGTRATLIVAIGLGIALAAGTLDARAPAARDLCWIPTDGPADTERLLAGGCAVHQVLPGGVFALLAADERAALAGGGRTLQVVAGEDAVRPGLVVLRLPAGSERSAWYASLRLSGSVLWEADGFALAAVDPGETLSLSEAGAELRDFPLRPRRAPRLAARPSPRTPEAGRAPAGLDSFTPEVDGLVAEVTAQSFHQYLAELSGVVMVTVEGAPAVLSTRYTLSSKNRTAGYYIAEQLASYGYPVELQWFDARGAMRFNVVATREGLVHPDEIYVLGAHYDDTSETPVDYAPGANDNGSGTAVVLQAARVFADAPTEATVKFVAFTGEEQGMLGSYEFVSLAEAAGDEIAGAVILDMVSFYNSSYAIQVEGGIPWEPLMNVMVASADRYTSLGTIKTYFSWGSDHVPFQEAGYPAFLAIEDEWDGYSCYHRTCDVLGRQNVDMGADVTRASVGAVGSLARVIAGTAVAGAEAEAAAGAPAPAGDELALAASPNPTTGTTAFTFALARAGQARLALYDVNGREVALVAEGPRQAGAQTVTWAPGGDATGLASGIYFAVLRAGGEETVRRIVVLR